MRCCYICRKKYSEGCGTLFGVPKDSEKRNKWSKNCGINFPASASICANHFLSSNIIHAGSRLFLMPNAKPFTSQFGGVESSADEKNNSAVVSKKRKNLVFKNQKRELNSNLLTFNNNAMPLQLQEEPIIQMPPIKSVTCAGYTQTNVRFCGLVQASDLGDEFRLNCFYCSEIFPLQKWKKFVTHLKNKHFEMEEAFNISKYVSKEHDYTTMGLPASTSTDAASKTVVLKARPLLPFLVDPLEASPNSFESIVLNPTCYDTPAVANSKTSNDSGSCSKNVNHNLTKKILNKYKTKNNSKVMSSGIVHLRNSKRQTKETVLSRCLKRRNIKAMGTDVKEEYKTFANEAVQQKPIEIAFEYTPRDIVDSLLDNMKNYPVLWHFDDKPFNEDFHKAVEDLCKIINYRWELNIDNLTMRRSINRILRFYCNLYPNSNVENIDQFTCYYDKCAAFLPSSVTEIAYARCFQCYICYKNDFDLKRHLLEEQKYLQWPYKCLECKECFRESDEYEFHKRLPHYDEIFRCEQCNKTFYRRNIYNKHMSLRHPKEGIERDKYKCNICGKAFQFCTNLSNHKIIHEEKKYKCHLCPKTYYMNAKLALHLKSHRKEYDFICEVCGKGFIIQKALIEHMKKHTGAKVTCNICNLKLRKSSLRRHLRVVHMAFEDNVQAGLKEENPYYRRLIRLRPLQPNKRSGKRQYRCKICNISFENYKIVVEHNKELHSDIQKWPCQMCNTEFNLKYNLKAHYRRKHKLHVIQVFKLVEENEDLNKVLAMDAGDLNKVTEHIIVSKNEADSATKLNIKTPINSEPNLKTQIKSKVSLDYIYFEEEKVHSSTIQDGIMQADNVETQELKIDMNYLLTDMLKESKKR